MSLRLKVQGPVTTVGMSVPITTSIVEFKKLLVEILSLEEGQSFTVLIGYPPAPIAVPEDKDEDTVQVSQILRSGDAVRVVLQDLEATNLPPADSLPPGAKKANEYDEYDDDDDDDDECDCDC